MDGEDKLNPANAAAGGLKSAEEKVGGAALSHGRGDLDSVRKNEASPRGFYSGDGKSVNNEEKSKNGFINILKDIGPVGIILVLIIGLMAVFMVGVPAIIGTIKENLIKSLGFTDTIAILEEVAEYKLADYLRDGKVPDALAEDFSVQGIEVGQLTIAGDFVRTNNYLADLDGSEVAADKEFYNGNNGELVVRFDGEIVKADDFVMAVESSPKMYAAYSDGLNMLTKYTQSDEMDAVITGKLGIDRDAFSGWSSTGDYKKDEESFNEIFTKMLDIDFNLNTAGKYMEEEEKYNEDKNGNKIMVKECVAKTWSYDSLGSKDEGADGLVEAATKGSRSNANGSGAQNAAQYLNMTLSAAMPYLASSAFFAMMEGIETAQIGGNGPVNFIMNRLTDSTEITYIDSDTKETKVEDKSILETRNFVAGVTDENYSKKEAVIASRDQIFKITGLANPEVIKNSVVSMDGSKTGAGFTTINSNCQEASPEGLDVTAESVRLILTESNSDVFSSIFGGNQIISGGSYTKNFEDQNLLGAFPSDATTVTGYQREVSKVLERQKEADRATKSPFDVSSPNTFMGKIARSLATTMIKSYSSRDKTVFGSVSGVLTGMLDDSVDGLAEGALADNEENHLPSLIGDCDSVAVAFESTGDYYCNAHNTISTKYMDYTDDYWKKESILKDSFDENGDLKEKGFVGDAALFGSDREATVGLKSEVICKRYKENMGFLKKALSSIKEIARSVVKGADELEDQCEGVPDDLATGAYYTLSDSNPNREKIEAVSAYMVHDRVMSLLSGEESRVTSFLKKYNEEHPLDDSYKGKLARISGLSVDKVEMALDYYNYLTEIAQQKYREVYNFTARMEPKEDILQFSHDINDMMAVYGLWRKELEFADVRNRSFAI